MGSGTTATCKSCDRSWTVSGDINQYVITDNGNCVICPHPVESLVAEQVTGMTVAALSKGRRFRFKIPCHCLSCLNSGDYSWDLRGGEAFLKRDAMNGDLDAKSQSWLEGVPEACIRRCGWFECAACGKYGALVSDSILELLLSPVAMIFALRKQSPVRCPDCKVGRLHFDLWIS